MRKAVILIILIFRKIKCYTHLSRDFTWEFKKDGKNAIFYPTFLEEDMWMASFTHSAPTDDININILFYIYYLFLYIFYYYLSKHSFLCLSPCSYLQPFSFSLIYLISVGVTILMMKECLYSVLLHFGNLLVKLASFVKINKYNQNFS